MKKTSTLILLVHVCLLSHFGSLYAGNIVVTTSAASAAGSLNASVIGAASGDTIIFDPTINGQIITLNTGQITINKSLTIIGNGITNTIIDGDELYRVFDITSGDVTIQHLTIQNGMAVTSSGGGISHSGTGTVDISYCAFRDCYADLDGGGIINESGMMAILGCTFDGNHAEFDGGGIRINSGTVLITGCTFSDNSASISGGGIRRVGGSVMVVNATITGNTADLNGGGFEGRIDFINCTIANNNAGNHGGGGKSDQTTFTNCIVYGNTATGSSPNLDDPIISHGFNIFGDTTGTSGLINFDRVTNPLLSALADNGGPTQTMAIDCHSPAANTGTSTGAPIRDQRGVNRYMTTDIGAYEFAPVQMDEDIHLACNSFTWMDGNTYTESNNSATYAIADASGCDSVVIFLNLTIDTIDFSVTAAGLALTANQSGATYQWLDCDDNYAPIPGATSQQLTIPHYGGFAVVITKLCSDTSVCEYVFESIGIDEQTASQSMFVYPNPATNQLFIQSSGANIIEINLYNSTGALARRVASPVSRSIDISELAAGAYIAEVKSKDASVRRRWMKL